MSEASHERVPLSPHFRQALPNPLERSPRTALLDHLSDQWLTWSRDDPRWATVEKLTVVLTRLDDAGPRAFLADALSAAIAAAHSGSLDELREAVGDLGLAAKL